MSSNIDFDTAKGVGASDIIGAEEPQGSNISNFETGSTVRAAAEIGLQVPKAGHISFSGNLKPSRSFNTSNDISAVDSPKSILRPPSLKDVVKPKRRASFNVPADDSIKETAVIGEDAETDKDNPKEAPSEPDNKDNGKHVPATHSMGTVDSSQYSGTGHHRMRELIETPMVKFKSIRFLLMAIASNVVLIILLLLMYSGSGLVMPVNGQVATHAGPVMFQTLMHVCHHFSASGLAEATGILFGYLLAQKRGQSLALCGYAHSSFLEKLSFPGILSYKSKCKRLLNRLNYIWVVQALLIVATVFSSSGIKGNSLRYDNGQLSCIVYGQEGEPFDRGFPNLQTAMGSAEYIFGTGLGLLTSEDSSLKNTVHVFPVQLADTAMDGTTLVGSGFTTNITTQCKCANGIEPRRLINAGVPPVDVEIMAQKYDEIKGQPGMVNSIGDAVNDTITIVTLLVGERLCGGVNVTSPKIPVCTTVLSDHRHATVLSQYMTDGTPASIATESVQVRESHEPANVNWLHASLINLFEGQRHSFTPLVQTIPGTTNPLLWWTTVNMQNVSPSYLEPGLETTWAMLLRVAMQRTFSTDPQLCTQNIQDDHFTTFVITGFGLTFGLLFGVGELIINVLSLAACFTWFFFSPNPISPAIRMAVDKTYFSFQLAGPLTAGILSECNMAMNSQEAWAKLDLVVRVGETMTTRDDPEFGTITVDRPKIVASFAKGKLYS